MQMRDLLGRERVISRLTAGDKRDVLRKLAAHAATDAAVPVAATVRAVLECVELPDVGPGAGVSLPHAYVPGLGSAIVTFARLNPPVDFDAADGSKTDLVALLLSPTHRQGDHLLALACVARVLRVPKVRDLLRAADGGDALYVILTGNEELHWSGGSTPPSGRQAS